MNRLRISLVAGALWLSSWTALSQQQPSYLDPKLRPEQRAADLVHRMTLAEKASQPNAAHYFCTSADQLPPFDSYAMQGRTYRYFKGIPLYPFGYGLSYTTFSYSALDISF